MSIQSLLKVLRPCFERGCLLGWMLVMTINTAIFGLAAELLVCGATFARFHLINETSVQFLFYGVIAAVGFPLMAKMWNYGVENLNFLVHESAFNQMVEPPQSWSDGLLTLLDENAQRSQELAMLVRLIDEAPGAVERQDRRAEARAWLKNNRASLNEEDLEFAKQHLGYLRY